MGAITKTDVTKARIELDLMRRSLVAWLAFRARNVAAGVEVPGRAQYETALANRLHALLSVVMPESPLPTSAVQLAQVAITGQAPVYQSEGAQGMGSIAATLTAWPVLIVGGLLLAVVVAIRSYADVAKDAEEKACIRAGACTDYGFWLKAGGVVALTWVAWQNGLGDFIRRTLKGGKRS